MDIWQNFPFERFGIPSPFPSQRQGTVAPLFQIPVIWVSAPTSFLTMTLQFLGFVTASFGAGQSQTKIGSSSEQPWGLSGSPLRVLLAILAGPVLGSSRRWLWGLVLSISLFLRV